MTAIQIPETIKLAINRLAQIQAQERVLKKEKEELRGLTLNALIAAGQKKVTTTLGHNAAIADRVTETADKAYILSVLTEPQKLVAYTTKYRKVLTIR